LALQRWGEPRLTQDVDLTVISGFGREAQYADQFLSAFAPRIPDARAFALRHRVLLLLGRDGIAVRPHRRLDEGLIWQELIPLLELKEDDQTGPRLRRLLEHR
jgi:hypothetical protein